MTEYIEREAVLMFQTELTPCICVSTHDWDIVCATKDADLVRYIESIPAADVVEVVRCKDCIHREDEAWLTVRGVTRIVAKDVCRNWSGGCATSPDAYCSYGERKQDNV